MFRNEHYRLINQPELSFFAAFDYCARQQQNFAKMLLQNVCLFRVDACESRTEVTTPFWATNNNGQVRAVVNTKHFEQAVHQEICSSSRTLRCAGDCQCEQK